jgi:sugar phosphate isomerase/epimerase
MTYPRIHLAIDNCFASKRWTHPQEWMQIAKDLDIRLIEASADNECDPLYSPPEALADWRKQVRSAALASGGRVANFYSGHGTYATLGLAHPDRRVRDHVQHQWLEVMIKQAAELGAGLGFFCHAIKQDILHDPEQYRAAMHDLYARLAQVAQSAQAAGLPSIGVEQMYSPHQPPWTINGALELLREVFARGGAPFYLTLDLGHAIGQSQFLRPSPTQIEVLCEDINADRTLPDMWFPFYTSEYKVTPRQIAESFDARPHLFARPEDGDPYAWLRMAGAYSPIVHLQQTDGTVSAHRPFTRKFNETGIIDPKRVLQALKASYDAPELPGLPPRISDVYLTLEIFSGTAQRYDTILKALRESAAYWRAVVPEDGRRLDALVPA